MAFPLPPYGIIRNHLNDGQVIPFLGAGASHSGRPRKARWTEGEARFPPDGCELARLLAHEAKFPSAKASDCRDLAKVASYYQDASDRPALVERLHTVFVKEFAPGRLHHFLAGVPSPLLIVTTNYDDLLEQAFQQAGRPYHLVVHPTDRPEHAASVLWWRPDQKNPSPVTPSELKLSLTDTSIIYKMHGSVDRKEQWDSFLVTEEDYVSFLARMTGQAAIPARFTLTFRKSRFLFLGYGLGDWNLRVMLSTMRQSVIVPQPDTSAAANRPHSPQDRKSWAIQRRPSVLEKRLWGSRGVDIYDMDIDAFVKELEAFAPPADSRPQGDRREMRT